MFQHRIRRVSRLRVVLAFLVWQPCMGMVADPLPSWNEGATKQAILGFVAAVTREGGPEFVPVPDRIATFDNDGTLWSEQPAYFQLTFAANRMRQIAEKHPEFRERPIFKAAIEGDLGPALAGTVRDRLELVGASHAGLTVEEYTAVVYNWHLTARHPRFDRLYTDLVYQPMLELLAYLRDNGFQTYIVSGGGAEFMRVWAEEIYGIPRERVVGSTIKVRYEERDGEPVIVRLAEVELIDDGAGKVEGIHRTIGRRPIAAFGNSDGDYEMLRWSTSGRGKRLGLIVHHTDAKREWSYDRNSRVGRLSKALDEAPRRGWVVLDMKEDWRVIYPFQAR
jgi:phosphoserine phosphatase